MNGVLTDEIREDLQIVVDVTVRETEEGGSVESETRSTSFDWSLHQYMKEVNALPLLSHERTMDLFRDLEEGQEALQRLGDASEPASGDAGARQAVEARIARTKEQLVTSNLRLVVYLANRYQGRGISIQDLVQEGNIGLIRAIDKFDYRLGYRFSTYATWWIRQGMLRAIHQQGRLIRIPTHMLEKFQRYVRSSEAVQPSFPDPPEREEGSHDPEASEDHGEMILLMEVMRDPLSLDAPMTDDGLDLQEVTRDENQAAPEDRVIAQDLRVKLRAALSSLSLREDVILRLRYGIDLPSAHTLEEVGHLFQLTKERIRQIESRALKRLYHLRAA